MKPGLARVPLRLIHGGRGDRVARSGEATPAKSPGAGADYLSSSVHGRTENSTEGAEMVFGPQHLGLDPVAGQRDVQRGRAQSTAASRTDSAPASISATPPPDVLEALDTAARVLEELAAKRISLHFEYDDHANQVRVQVISGDGKLVREIPPSVLVDIAAGAPVPAIA
jgi:uncharacterized FlaG/YvyC family protein